MSFIFRQSVHVVEGKREKKQKTQALRFYPGDNSGEGCSTFLAAFFFFDGHENKVDVIPDGKPLPLATS